MAMTGFKAYRAKGGSTRAARIEGDGDTFYIVAQSDHDVKAVPQVEFEAEYSSAFKGIIKEGTFKNYRKKGGDTNAQVLEATVTIEGEDFGPGDYMILDNGVLRGAKKADFEATFELVKKNYNKPKSKAKASPAAKAEKAA